MSDRLAKRPQMTTGTRALFIVLLGVVMVAALIGGGWWVKWRGTVDRQRGAASAAAEARAQRFASELLSAFASGPRSVDSLRPLGAEAGIDYVTAAMDGGSVIVTWESSEEYATGNGLTPTSRVVFCMRGVIFSRPFGSDAASVEHPVHGDAAVHHVDRAWRGLRSDCRIDQGVC